MAGTTDAVYKLLNEIWTPALERAKGELAEMEELFQKDYPDGEFASWDWWYYAEKVRKQKYQLEEELLRPYFSLENAVGDFLPGEPPLRHHVPSHRRAAVPSRCDRLRGVDADESHLGVLYFDYFPRDGKSQGAWCGNYVEQTYEDGKRWRPWCRSSATSPARRATPRAADPRRNRNAVPRIPGMRPFPLPRREVPRLTEVEGDFVELPSQLMENWAFDPEVLKQYAVHYRSNEVIPGIWRRSCAAASCSTRAS